MTQRGRVLLGAIALCIALGAGPSKAEAALITYSGCISSTGSVVNCQGLMEIADTADWSSAFLSWVITGDTSSGLWQYVYTFGFSGGPALSHGIIEVSDVFGDADIVSLGGCEIDDDLVDDYSGSNPSNPEMPAGMKGLKCDTLTEDNPVTWTLVTTRVPVWGDFYAKGGNPRGNYGAAWNAGFLALDPAEAAANGSLRDHILRPDTQTIDAPEPAALVLLGLGLMFSARRLRRKA